MIFGLHTDIFVLIAMLGLYLLWAVWRTSGTPRRTPVQDELLAQGKQNSDLLVRQTVALERIASALEKPAP